MCEPQDIILVFRLYADEYPHVTVLDNIIYFDLDLGLQQRNVKHTQLFFSRKVHLVRRNFPLEGYWEMKIYGESDIQVQFKEKQFLLIRDHINIIRSNKTIRYIKFNEDDKHLLKSKELHYVFKYLDQYSLPSESQLKSIDGFFKPVDTKWNIPNDCNPDTFVISGGGIHGISVLGTIYCFRNLIPKINNFFGTSSGSIISFLLALGLDILEMYELLFSLDSSIKAIDDNMLSTFLLVMSNYSLNSNNDKLQTFLEDILIKKIGKKELTFRELFRMNHKLLVICGTCLNNGKAEYFSVVTQPDMNIIQAILISTCLPVIWSPQVFENKVYVDGGVVDNTPVFEAMRSMYSEVRGLLLVNPDLPRELLIKNYWNNSAEISTHSILNTRNILCFEIKKDLSKLISTKEIMKTFPNYFSFILDSLSSISTITYIPKEFKKYIINTFVPIDISARDLNISNESKQNLFYCGNLSGIDYVRRIQEYNL